MRGEALNRSVDIYIIKQNELFCAPIFVDLNLKRVAEFGLQFGHRLEYILQRLEVRLRDVILENAGSSPESIRV